MFIKRSLPLSASVSYSCVARRMIQFSSLQTHCPGIITTQLFQASETEVAGGCPSRPAEAYSATHPD